MRKFTYIFILIFALFLSGCNPIGDKSTSMSIIYMATAFLSLVLLIGHFFWLRKQNLWFSVLFSSVFVVNTGYFLLSVCKTLDLALFANRLAYLGSVFLPLSMLMIVLNITQSKYKKWLPYALSAINFLVFLVTASYPLLDIYYTDVTIKIVNGVSVLDKTYGFLHPLYLVFLLSYFVAMIAVTAYTSKKKKLNTNSQTIVMTIAVFVNICVWLLEQLVQIDFEFLSVSYIISELFLIGLYLAIEESNAINADFLEKEPTPEECENVNIDEKRLSYFIESISHLTPTEKRIYDCYIQGKSTKEVLELLTIKENTLKYHNKNIYGKLGVSSRKELRYFASLIK